MNWQKYAAIIAVTMPLIGGAWWTFNNVTWAADFNSYQTEQAVRWKMYDNDRLWREYRDVKSIKDKNALETRRMDDLSHELERSRDELNSLRK